MTLRARLAAAFFVVVLGPVVLGGYLLLSLLMPGPSPTVALDPASVRVVIAARCQQLASRAAALAVTATVAGQSFAVTPADATGTWAVCGGPDLLLPPVVTLPAGTRYSGLAARARIGGTGGVAGYAYAVQRLDPSFLAELSVAAGTPLILVGVGDPRARPDLALPLAGVLPPPTSVPAAPTWPIGLAAGASALLVSAGFAWWLAGLAIRPMYVLLRAVERVVAGDLTVRSNLAGRDITGRLGRGLDRLIAGMQEAQHLSVTDALTGLGNVRQLSESLRREVERAGRFGRSLGILALDLDHFKEVNDRYGHRAGDAVLMEFSRRLRGVVREVDQAFRPGGEEFVILLPETDVAGSLTAARRIGEAMREAAFRVEPARIDDPPEAWIPVTVSIGIAVFPRHALTGAAVLDAADAALYAAKAAGRDTFAVAGPVLPAARAPRTSRPGSPVLPAALAAEAGGASGGTTSPRSAPGG